MNWSYTVHILVLLVSVSAFAVLTSIAADSGLNIDTVMLTFAADHRNELLDAFFLALTWLGSLYVLAPIILITVIILIRYHAYMAATLLGAGLAGAALLCHIAKYLVERDRPQLFSHLVEVYQPVAFPSGHATHITALSLAIMLLLWPKVRWRSIVTGMLVLLTLLVAISRIYLQVHYPSDVLAGLLLGITWVTGINLMLKLFTLSANADTRRA